MYRLLSHACLVLAMSLAGAMAARAAPDMPSGPRYLRIYTGPATEASFPIGVAIAAAISHPPDAPPCPRSMPCGIPDTVAMAFTSTGPAANIRALREGQADAILVQADSLYPVIGAAPQQEHGTGNGEAGRNLSSPGVVASLYPALMHVVVRHDSGIGRLEELGGRRVSVGAEGSGTQAGAREILRQFLGEDTPPPVITEEEPAAAVELLDAGRLDAFFMLGAWPARTVSRLLESGVARLLPVPAGKPRTGVINSLSFFFTDEIPAGAYPGTGSLETLGIPALLAVSLDMDPGLVYTMTKSLWRPDMQEVLRSSHPAGARIVPEGALRGVFSPFLHPGAARFYREAGLLAG